MPSERDDVNKDDRHGRNPSGLCMDCIHEPDCTYPRDSNRPVQSCDEFTPPRSKPSTYYHEAADSVHEKTHSVPLEDDAGAMLGLCRTCVHREVCKFPKTEGGVWHCTEFE